MFNSNWPLFDLRVTTPRLELRYVTDELGFELANLAAKGVHDPAKMPFIVPWTDVAPPLLQQNCLRFYWTERANTSPEHWDLLFAAVVDGQAIGLTSLTGANFATTRSFNTGSWLGRAFQGKGLGKEVRLATLHLGFLGLEAELARTSAYEDNAPSLGVTRSIGYIRTGESAHSPRGVPQRSMEFELSREQFLKTANRSDIEMHNIAACLPMLGLEKQA